MYTLIIYVPEDHLEIVKEALFDAGAGMIGNYSKCCYTTQGYGQFMPNQAANPNIGSSNVLEVLPEAKLEILCPFETLKAVEQAIKIAHPYEEPVYYFIKHFSV